MKAVYSFKPTHKIDFSMIQISMLSWKKYYNNNLEFYIIGDDFKSTNEMKKAWKPFMPLVDNFQYIYRDQSQDKKSKSQFRKAYLLNNNVLYLGQEVFPDEEFLHLHDDVFPIKNINDSHINKCFDLLGTPKSVKQTGWMKKLLVLGANEIMKDYNLKNIQVFAGHHFYKITPEFINWYEKYKKFAYSQMLVIYDMVEKGKDFKDVYIKNLIHTTKSHNKRRLINLETTKAYGINIPHPFEEIGLLKNLEARLKSL